MRFPLLAWDALLLLAFYPELIPCGVSLATRRSAARTISTFPSDIARAVYVEDNEPGEALRQDGFEFGGRWFVVQRGGKPVR